MDKLQQRTSLRKVTVAARWLESDATILSFRGVTVTGGSASKQCRAHKKTNTEAMFMAKFIAKYGVTQTNRHPLTYSLAKKKNGCCDTLNWTSLRALAPCNAHHAMACQAKPMPHPHARLT